jgi:hypothetical protein
MNERIKELAEQSIAEYWPQPYNDRKRILENFSDFMEIFAKSIVKECANVAADHDALDIYEEIREHFGVTNV